MKRTLTVTTMVLSPAIAVTFFLTRPADRIPERARWILDAKTAQVYEMDALMDPSAVPRPTVGFFTGKTPISEGPMQPSDGDWVPVEEPRTIYRELLIEFQEALSAFDAEHVEPVVYAPPIEPRMCVRFEKPDVVYDVYVCLIYKQVLIKDVTNSEVYRGRMSDSYVKFVDFTAKLLPHDERTLFALSRLRPGGRDGPRSADKSARGPTKPSRQDGPGEAVSLADLVAALPRWGVGKGAPKAHTGPFPSPWGKKGSQATALWKPGARLAP